MPLGSGSLGGAAPHSAASRTMRAVGAGVWLIYLILPLRSVFGPAHSTLYAAGAVALFAAFAVTYLALIVMCIPATSAPHRLAGAGIAVLFAIAMATSIIYGSTGITTWIFVASAAAWGIRDRNRALRAFAGVVACYLLFASTSHLGPMDFLSTLLPVVLVGVAVLGLRRRMELTRQLTQARDEVERMAAAAERLRLARDLHDLTGQSLSTITLKSELAARLVARLPESPERDRAADEIGQVAEVSRQALSDIRQAVSGYRRPTLAVEAITARSALESAGITSHDDSRLSLVSGTFDPDAEAALAWCLREAVTNVVRHSGARNCRITLSRRSGTVRLSVRDDGRGSRPGESAVHTPLAVSTALSSPPCASSGEAGTGLRGMSERLAVVGGELELSPGPDGFALTASVPAGKRVTVTS